MGVWEGCRVARLGHIDQPTRPNKNCHTSRHEALHGTLSERRGWRLAGTRIAIWGPPETQITTFILRRVSNKATDSSKLAVTIWYLPAHPWRTLFNRNQCRAVTYVISRKNELSRLFKQHPMHIAHPYLLQQEAQLSQRDRATHNVSRNLVKCWTVVWKITFERLAVGNDLESDSCHRICLYSIGHYITIYYWSAVTTTLSGTVSRYYHIYSVRDRLTLRSTSFSKRWLKLQATCAFRFMCKHIIDNTRCISRGMWDRKVTKSKKWPSRSLKVTGNGVIL